METVDLLIQLFNESHQDEQWLIKLNRYERDNLLALINAIGWPAPWRLEKERRVRPDPNLGPWHSGDWMGQIGNKLQRRSEERRVGKECRL